MSIYISFEQVLRDHCKKYVFVYSLYIGRYINIEKMYSLISASDSKVLSVIIIEKLTTLYLYNSSKAKMEVSTHAINIPLVLWKKRTFPSF